MKYIFAVAMAFLVVISSLTTGTSVQAQPSTTPEETARHFYEFYLQSLNRGEQPLEKHKAELSRLITQRLMKSYERASKRDTGINADFFLDAQDSDEAWAKNITVSKAEIKGARATLNVMLKGGPLNPGDSNTWDNKLKVGLVKEDGVWKIDTVNGKASVT